MYDIKNTGTIGVGSSSSERVLLERLPEMIVFFVQNEAKPIVQKLLKKN
jgi:hypothetical protein